MTAGFIGASGVRSCGRAFTLSLTYVVGMALVYSGLEAFAALTGGIFGAGGTNPWAYLAVANVMILMALGMLDVFALQVPPSITSWLGRLGGGASGQSVRFGIALLFAFSLGLGTLLLIVGTFSGLLSALPRAGPWMLWVKRAFAVILLGAGEYFLVQTGTLLI